ncbi:mitochondrial 54S ribosomal protein bL31m [Kockiozyma suomiensis]|uniref:mitochondrial 54S ribosomal protein bL31m n=1 Tax=Kockiozyma suomiensis TaxID=1337062 RepID=UPI003343FF01
MALSTASRSRPLCQSLVIRQFGFVTPHFLGNQQKNQQPEQLTQRRAYDAQLPRQRRQKRHLPPGKTTPAVYHMFDCLVEMSDGSTYVRQSPFPRVEWRYLRDQRTHPLWNPTISGLVAVQADTGGRVARFNEKFGSTDEFAEDEEEAEEEESVFDGKIEEMFEDFEHKESLNVRVFQKVRTKGRKGAGGGGRYI